MSYWLPISYGLVGVTVDIFSRDEATACVMLHMNYDIVFPFEVFSRSVFVIGQLDSNLTVMIWNVTAAITKCYLCNRTHHCTANTITLKTLNIKNSILLFGGYLEFHSSLFYLDVLLLLRQLPCRAVPLLGPGNFGSVSNRFSSYVDCALSLQLSWSWGCIFVF